MESAEPPPCTPLVSSRYHFMSRMAAVFLRCTSCKRISSSGLPGVMFWT